jgi:topoisomerase-4 subunit A
MGNIVTKYPVKKILLKSKGISTLAGRKIWYDDILKRLNADNRGKYLGEFDGDDRILTVMANGTYELTSFDLNNHFDDKMIIIERYNPEKVYSVVHYDGKSKNYLIKRFSFENTAIGKQTSIISDEPGSKMLIISGAMQPIVKVDQLKGATKTPETVELNLADLIDVKGMKAMGNRLSVHIIQNVTLMAEHDDEADVPDPEPDSVAETEIVITPEDKVATDLPPAIVEETIAPEIVQEIPEQIKETPKSVKSAELKKEIEKPVTKEEPPVKKVDFEITNPDDVEIDDKGQLGLF